MMRRHLLGAAVLAVAIGGTVGNECNPCRITSTLTCIKSGKAETQGCVAVDLSQNTGASAIIIGIPGGGTTIFNSQDSTGQPTAPPSVSPTKMPTPPPTLAPTGSGSGSTPTQAPSPAPTSAPTPAPTELAPAVGSSDPCDFVSAPDACKCANPRYDITGAGEVKLVYDLVPAVEGTPCLATVSGSSIIEANNTNQVIDTDQTVCGNCIDSCCIKVCNITKQCTCRSNVRPATVKGTTFNVCHKPAISTLDPNPPTPDEDCDDDTAVIIIVVVFGVLLLFVICVALYFCLSKKEPVHLNTSNAAGAGSY